MKDKDKDFTWQAMLIGYGIAFLIAILSVL